MENLEDEIKENTIWDVKMGKIARNLIREKIIKKYNRLEGNIRIKDKDRVIITITYSPSHDKFYIRLRDNFYEDEGNKVILDNVIKNIKEIDENQEIFVF